MTWLCSDICIARSQVSWRTHGCMWNTHKQVTAQQLKQALVWEDGKGAVLKALEHSVMEGQSTVQHPTRVYQLVEQRHVQAPTVRDAHHARHLHIQ